jgi:hypothetical protein
MTDIQTLQAEGPSPVIARTVRDFCRTYGIGKTLAYELMAAGKIEARKVSPKKTLILEASVLRWLAECPRSVPVSQTREDTNGSEPMRKRQYHKSRVHKGKQPNTNQRGR